MSSMASIQIGISIKPVRLALIQISIISIASIQINIGVRLAQLVLIQIGKRLAQLATI